MKKNTDHNSKRITILFSSVKELQVPAILAVKRNFTNSADNINIL